MASTILNCFHCGKRDAFLLSRRCFHLRRSASEDMRVSIPPAARVREPPDDEREARERWLDDEVAAWVCEHCGRINGMSTAPTVYAAFTAPLAQRRESLPRQICRELWNNPWSVVAAVGAGTVVCVLWQYIVS